MIATLLGLHGRNPSQTRSSPFLVGHPMGLALTSLRAFHGWTRRLPCFSGFAWWIKFGPGPFEVKPWSGPVLKKSFEWRALFRRKGALTECSPRASCYLEQKFRGSWIFVVGKIEKSHLRICTLQPWAYIRVLFIQEELGYRVFSHILKCPSFCGWLVVFGRWVG
jgi:hypothetical protein